MKVFFSIMLALLLCSCGHRYLLTKELVQEYNKRATQKMDTLIVEHQQCTGCAAFQIVQGRINVPPDVSGNSVNATDKNINVCGNFPVDLADHDGATRNSAFAYRLIGKVIKAEPGNNNSSTPLFYVDRWERFSFDKEQWMSKDNRNSYSQRPKMITGIMRNVLFEGQPVASIVNLLGEPDQKEKNKIRYHIDDEPAAGEESASSTNFTILFGEDSAVITKSVTTEWR